MYSHSAWELQVKMILSCDTDTATPHIVFLLAYTRINPGSIKIRALRRLPSSELLGLLGAVVNCCKSFLSQLSSTSPAACSNHREWYNKPVCDAGDDCPERHKEILSVSLFIIFFYSFYTGPIPQNRFAIARAVVLDVYQLRCLTYASLTLYNLP